MRALTRAYYSGETSLISAIIHPQLKKFQLNTDHSTNHEKKLNIEITIPLA